MTDPVSDTAVVAVLATAVGFLGWIIKKQFNQNNTTVREATKANQQNTQAYIRLSHVIEKLEESISKRDENDRQFQEHVIAVLTKLSEKQDVIHETINTTNMTVQNLYVKHQEVDS